MAITRLNIKAVPHDVFVLLQRIMLDSAFDDFYLVGGTALALQIGHRMSVDIDLFTGLNFHADRISETLSKVYGAREIEVEQYTVRAVIHNIKMDVMAHKYPLLEPLEIKDAIRMASLKDIAAMKINAIASRGSKKDFWDYASLLDFFTTEDMLSFFQSKYSSANVWHAEKSLSYFDDAELEPDPNDISGKTWEQIKQRINHSLKA